MRIGEKQRFADNAIVEFNPRTALEEAKRCLLCHEAPCSAACPAGTNPAKFIRSVRFNNIKGAAETIRTNNPLAGSCAKICPCNKLCQEACSRCGIDKPIKIGKIQSFVVKQEQLFDMEVMSRVNKEKKGRIACIGAGPASLTVAAKLAECGYDVVVYEMAEKAGGIMTYGITPERLPQDVVDYDISLIEKLGVKFEFLKEINSIMHLKDEGFDAIFIGIGLWEAKKPSIPGSDLKGVWTALDYLKAARISNSRFEAGNRVVVIGGGDVAMDCAATAKLAGADKVMVYYRRTIEEAPADIDEMRYVQDMGVTITTEFIPNEIIRDSSKNNFILFKGRDGESSAKIKADTIVFAIGQKPKNILNLDLLDVNEAGCVKVDENGFSGVDGIFAAGDIVNGGMTVVEAVGTGKNVAKAIINYLEKREGVVDGC